MMTGSGPGSIAYSLATGTTSSATIATASVLCAWYWAPGSRSPRGVVNTS